MPQRDCIRVYHSRFGMDLIQQSNHIPNQWQDTRPWKESQTLDTRSMSRPTSTMDSRFLFNLFIFETTSPRSCENTCISVFTCTAKICRLVSPFSGHPGTRILLITPSTNDNFAWVAALSRLHLHNVGDERVPRRAEGRFIHQLYTVHDARQNEPSSISKF